MGEKKDFSLELEVKENSQLRQNIEDINREGWEEGAALIVGKKEEAERLRSRLETEGQAVDLATYIRLHKQIIIPAEEIQNLINFRGVKQTFGGEVKKGDFVVVKNLNNLTIFFFDKNLNLANVFIGLRRDSDITDIRQALEGQPGTPRDISQTASSFVLRTLLKLGFANKGMDYDGQTEAGMSWVRKLVVEYREDVAKKMASQKTTEFDF